MKMIALVNQLAQVPDLQNNNPVIVCKNAQTSPTWMTPIESVTSSVLLIILIKIRYKESAQIPVQLAPWKMKVIKNASLTAIKAIIKILPKDFASAIQEPTIIQQLNCALLLALLIIFKVSLFALVFLLSALKLNIGIRLTKAVQIVVRRVKLVPGRKYLTANHAIIQKKSSTVNAWIAAQQDFLQITMIIVNHVIFNAPRV
jgi:hypothetical protein